MSNGNFNQLYLDDNIFSEIVKELYNLYNKERLKNKNVEQRFDIWGQFLAKKNQNSNDIIKWCLENQINSMAQIILARCYQYGRWIEKDKHKAFTYYQKSADMELDEGIFNVGYFYDKGIGVEKDEHKAFIYYQKAAEMGHAGGTYNVGYCYQNGIGVERDEHKAFIYYQKAAEMGDAGGTVNVGYCYDEGIGVEKDEHKAFIYYQKAAEMGHAGGTNNVGYCYRNEIGVEEDEHKAFIYYQKSADMGHADGTVNAGYCYLNGIGVEKDEKKAFEYFKKAADMGVVGGILNVGNCYRNGIGVPKDIQRANHWYRIYRGVKRINKLSYEDIDDDLKKILDDEKYQLSWIPYNAFGIIREIGRGGFATVYYAYWPNKNTGIALKLIHGSNKSNQEFVQTLKNYCEIGYEIPSFLKCHGVSRDDKSKDYIIVMNYASKGSLRQNLPDVAQMAWKDKLNVLHSIVLDLESIHSQELFHRDLHSGNILQDHLHSAYITDLGLSISFDINQEGINGVVPYVAPEVLMGEAFTQAADIYSFGVIMSEVSSGRRAFDGEFFNDSKFAVRICRGKRPEFDKGAPDCYVKLAKKCMDQDPNKRPTATEIANKIGHWLDKMKQDDDNEIKKQFLEADKIKPNIELSIHLNHMYISKSIKIDEIIKLSEISDDQ